MLSLSGAIAILGALLFPTSGVARGYDAITSMAICARTDLQMAARSGALLMVIHDPAYFKTEGDESPYDETKIHGRCILPPGYRLVPVPRNAEFENDEPQFHTFWQRLTKLFGRSSDRALTVSCSYNAGKALVALGQALFAINTLYETRGDQIARYGYAAFGLTVAPYAWMSIINLVGSLICPEYLAIIWSNRRHLEGYESRLKCTPADMGFHFFRIGLKFNWTDSSVFWQTKKKRTFKLLLYMARPPHLS
ncbi:hypothetical protein K469DRAFT_744835 [Zopfia rhizophila CBS 207.26]|uniref:Uncharacterized protein n=1 Tax=Zopfia rhizophila CBS 207.26 TaxID=1314779 RepID=A0A6A6ERD9_9PEZI|nr:hypothetical protein K469DRAFT_744835 [Zopfia rhizophila CBS 207.26]